MVLRECQVLLVQIDQEVRQDKGQVTILVALGLIIVVEKEGISMVDNMLKMEVSMHFVPLYQSPIRTSGGRFQRLLPHQLELMEDTQPINSLFLGLELLEDTQPINSLFLGQPFLQILYLYHNQFLLL
jgi:hypothetical protein